MGPILRVPLITQACKEEMGERLGSNEGHWCCVHFMSIGSAGSGETRPVAQSTQIKMFSSTGGIHV